MSKEINILKKFIIWVLIFIGCMLVGIIRTYALTFTDFTDVHSNTTLYVGYADNGNPISWPYNNSTLYQTNIISLDYVVNTNITGGVHYEFESHMLGNYIISNPIYSVVDATGNTCLTDSYYLNFINGSYPRWDFQCPSNSTGFTIHIQQSNFSKLFNDGYMGWGSAILSKTTTPISSTGNDTEEIINNNNYNTNQIIDNQNQNTQDIIESGKVCSNIRLDKSYVAIDNKALNTAGNLQDNSSYIITRYIELSDNSTIKVIQNHTTTFQSCFYDKDKTKISCISANQMVVGDFLTIPSNAKYFRASINKSLDKPLFDIYTCQNGNQASTDAINGLKDSLTDDSPTDVSSLGNTIGWLPAGPIDSIINLPLSIFNSLNSALNSTCNPLHIPIPYVNKYLDIPCISTLIEEMGFKTFWNWVGTIASVVILYRYLLNLYKYYDDLTTLKANFISDFGGAP